MIYTRGQKINKWNVVYVKYKHFQFQKSFECPTMQLIYEVPCILLICQWMWENVNRLRIVNVATILAPSLLLVRGPATNINVCYLSSAKHKLNPPRGHAPAAYRGRWFPYVQYRGSHTRTLFALWRLKVFKIWIETPMIIETMSRRPSRDLKAKSCQRIAGKLFLSEFNYESPMEELRRLKCFQTINACMVMTVWADWDDRPYRYFFPVGKGWV